jgi:hypothetical protein
MYQNEADCAGTRLALHRTTQVVLMETAMLTGMFSATRLASRILAGGVMVLALSGVPFESAKAGGGSVGGACVGSGRGFACGGQWVFDDGPREPARRTPEEEAAAAERERKWTAHCRPVIKQDDYGVPRYQYAAPGCEFGKFPD